MPPPREFETVQQREIPATIVPTPSPKRNVTGIVDCNPNGVPASQQCLESDPDGAPMVEEWIYPSVVGMLLYLSGNARPDIAFAVSQVTSCSIKLGEYSLLWTFQLIRLIIQFQTEISLNTSPPKYELVSHTMRTLLPIRRMIEGPIALQLPSTLQATTCAEVSEGNNEALLEVSEDNNGALLLLATHQRITARTQFLLDKWHFFWYHINNGDAKVSEVNTELQDADYFTHGLPRESFDRNRRRVQGW
jgi:hypothetical protein